MVVSEVATLAAALMRFLAPVMANSCTSASSSVLRPHVLSGQPGT
jgi:hypothetical protein